MPPIRLSLSAAALSIATLPIATVTIATVTLFPLPARSQSLPVCEPPQPDEYLLIVVEPTAEIERQLQNALPGNATATVCTYLSDRVLRIDGFNTPEVAQSWAQYASDASGLRTFVARPPLPTATPSIAPPTTAASPTPPPVVPPADPFPQPTTLAAPSPAPTPAASIAPAPVAPASSVAPASPVAAAPTTATFNPQPLGVGYAVLVDYANRPEVATELRQVLARDVGLVAYGQRPYLLAVQTPDLAVANQVLQTLTDRNFAALIVDSQSAILLTPVVAKLD